MEFSVKKFGHVHARRKFEKHKKNARLDQTNSVN